MAQLKGTKTHGNLKAAFAGESQANRRYLYFAKVADVEGYPEVAGNFRETAEGETGHALGHLDYLKVVGDPATDLPIGDSVAEPQVGRRRRDPRVHRHVPGLRQDRARGGLRAGRRLVRDARQGREVPRRQVREDARQHQVARTGRDARVPGLAFRGRAARAAEGSTMAEAGKKVSYDPTPGLSYDPSQPVYWDPAALHGEVLRAFDICNGCRMCFKYCDSFPRLFELLDERDHDVHTPRAPPRSGRVMDDCFQCKLCEVQCPYTPRDEHPFQLDFPALVHRYDARQFRASGGKRRRCASGSSATPTWPGRWRACRSASPTS